MAAETCRRASTYPAAENRRRCASAWPLIVVLLSGGCRLEGEGFGQRAAAISGGEPYTGLEALGRLVVGGERRCGAVLVGQRTLLTSAHCLQEGQAVEILLDSGARLTAVATLLHPDYTQETDNWFGGGAFRDLAVIRLREPAPASPLTVSAVPPVRGSPIALVGYGATACHVPEAGPGEDAGLWCAPDGDLKRRAENTIDEVFQHEISIAGAFNACSGDSGGVVLGQHAGQELLLGIPAHGQMPCGTVSYATRLDAFAEWLLEAAEGDIQIYRPALDGGDQDGGPTNRDAAGGSDLRQESGAESAAGLEGSSGCSVAAKPALPLWLAGWLVMALRWHSRRRR